MEIRLQKIIADAGLASRREAERWIKQGNVEVNGQVVTQLGSLADPSADSITVSGKPVPKKQEEVFVVLNKADFMSYMTFESFLKAQTVSGIRNAYAKSLNDGVAEFEVEFEGKAQALAMGLAQTSPDGLTIKVTGLSGNRITAEVSQ